MPISDEQNQQHLKVLIPEVKLQARITDLAQEINHDYQGKEFVAVCILKGSFVFFSDIIRRLESPMTCEFLGVSSYLNKTVSSGEVKVTLDINEPLENRHVIVFEDIVDTGLTLSYIVNSLRARKPASLKVCALLMKPDSLRTATEVDYLGFKIGQEFVVGYGIDFSGKFRGLPYIGFIEHGH
jgi:hypoxanthine phosphoribosyltransferase